nr:phage integrase N-terminal SAM-like domain-containing protein [Pseudomonas argentinensis]KAB0550832.1 hypothetical protein F7R01_06410 [Pseudomonas argentinensis]
MYGQPRLFDQVREQIRLRHYSIRTERVYCEWVKRFIRFHRYRLPAGRNGGCRGRGFSI